MSRLTAAARREVSKSRFGLPGANGGKGAYPMPDREHAALAKADASKEEHAGKLSASSEDRIDAMANRILGKQK